MTALRPETSGSGEPPEYEYTPGGESAGAEFADPLSDPLPGGDSSDEVSSWFHPVPHRAAQQAHGYTGGVSGGQAGPDALAGQGSTPPPAAWQHASDPGGYGYAQSSPYETSASYETQTSYETSASYQAPASYEVPSSYRSPASYGDASPASYGDASHDSTTPYSSTTSFESPASYENPASYRPGEPGYGPGTAAWAAEAPVAPVAPEAGPATVAGPPHEGRRRAVDGPETAVMPVFDADDVSGGAPDDAPPPSEAPAGASGTEVAAGMAASAGAAAEAAAVVPGGRAARRRAAQQASRRGGAGRRAKASTPPPAPAAAGDGAAAAPLSRLEARRAARAAKESPAVIASRVTGEVFITLGVLMLLFVTYQLWWSNILAHQEAGGAANSLQKEWTSGEGGENSSFSPGQGFAIIYIPKLDVKAPIAQGVSKPDVLDKGMVGHYDGAPFDTAMPWNKTGNFALAAHRNTHGEPFRYINKLVKGDKVVVETQSTYYTYEITSMLPQTSPSNVSVIEPIPGGSGFTKPGRYITLTTCTPEFTSTYRLVVWGALVSQQPRSKGTPAVLQGG